MTEIEQSEIKWLWRNMAKQVSFWDRFNLWFARPKERISKRKLADLWYHGDFEAIGEIPDQDWAMQMVRSWDEDLFTLQQHVDFVLRFVEYAKVMDDKSFSLKVREILVTFRMYYSPGHVYGLCMATRHGTPDYRLAVYRHHFKRHGPRAV